MPSTQLFRSNKAGFTLVEIVVVIGIITLLTAILLPVLGRVREGGRRASCAAHLRQLGQAMLMYASDWDRFPRGMDPADTLTAIWADDAEAFQITRSTPLLTVVLDPYVKDDRLWQCPSDVGFDVLDSIGVALDARPSCYTRYGMSYLYRTQLTMINLAEEHLRNPTEVNVLFDADGAWHGGQEMDDRRYNMLFADGHVKFVTRSQYDDAWAQPVP